jgi:S-methylmethionine-dependent homocysteine/selenocysteine methylase
MYCGVRANTFATAPHVLRSKGYEVDAADQVNQQAIEVAREAREAAGVDDVWIAGSMSSMPALTEITVTAAGPGIAESYRRQAHALAEAGADLILAEMMLDIDNTALVLAAARETGLPVWIGFSAGISGDGHATSYRGTVDFNEMPVGDLGMVIDAALAHGAQAAGIMHSEMRAIGPALDLLRERWTGPTFAYAETGYFLNPDWDFSDAASPEEYANAAGSWVADHGATIVGGCCGTGPAHIQALRDRLTTSA